MELLLKIGNKNFINLQTVFVISSRNIIYIIIIHCSMLRAPCSVLRACVGACSMLRAPCVRACSVRACELRACSVRACVLRACSVRAPCVLRACSVRACSAFHASCSVLRAPCFMFRASYSYLILHTYTSISSTRSRL